jgi:thioredoxin reductase (NADPH)
VENYPGFEYITGAELAQKFARHAEKYGLETLFQEVIAIEPGLEYHTVGLDNGKKINTYSVILAMGGSPKKMGVPGEDDNYGKGVSYCAVCDGFFFRNKNVVVVGGGDSAAEESLYLAKIVNKVYIAHRRDSLRASRILQQRIQAECKIGMLWNTVISKINGEDSGVTSVSLKDTKTGQERDLPTNGVFVFIGFDPNNALVPSGVRMNTNGYVITDDKCETHIPGIFAIGDLRQKYARQIVIAASDGCTAALAAAHYVETKKSADTCSFIE